MMRLALGVACWAALACSPAFAAFDGVPLQPCDNRPPASARQPVAVAFSVLTVPGPEMFAVCNKAAGALVIYGCTFLPSAGHTAVILINGDQDPQEQSCTLVYEKAHLPPNNWLDQAMEALSPDAKP